MHLSLLCNVYHPGCCFSNKMDIFLNVHLSESFEFVLNFLLFEFFWISFLWTVHQKRIAGNNCHLSFCPTTSIVLTTITNIYVPRCIRIYMLNDPGSVAVCACAWWLRERLVDRLAPSTSRWEHACVSFSWDIFVIVGLCNDLDCYIYISLVAPYIY